MPENGDIAVRQLVWTLGVPEAVSELYFHYVQALPGWKRDFARYVHPDIREAVQLAYNKVRVKTASADYIFAFEDRTTFVPDASEHVRTGILQVFYNNTPVLRLGVSPADTEVKGNHWSPRAVEDFVDGEWVAELLELAPKLRHHESEQKAKDEAMRQAEIDGVAAIKARFSLQGPQKSRKRSWRQRLFGS